MQGLSKSEIFKKVALLCHSRLWNDEAAVAYLQQERKLTEQTIKQFKIGLFPKDLRELFAISDAKSLRDAGIIKHASRSAFQTWDLVLPVYDVYGDCIAMVGRTLMSEEKRDKAGISKYYNSVYSKGQHLFGLNLAKRSILESGVAYVVEGHYDVIMPHQHGMTNVVAVCGSNLSTRQLSLLSRYTDKIVLLFDNEPKAIHLASQIVQRKQREGLTLLAQNPFPEDVKDLDEYLRQHSVDSLLKRLEEASEFDNICPAW